MMEIQEHDGMVEVAGFQQGFAKHCGRREMCHGREREAPGARVLLASLPPLFLGVLGGRWPLEIPSEGGVAKGVACPPSQVGRPPHPQGFQA